MMNCDSIKDSVVKYLQSETEVISKSRYCILSLPIRVIDGANAEVFIEETGVDSFLVHDGGRTLGHLESCGVIASSPRIAALSSLAQKMGVALDDGVFKAIARKTNLNDAVFSVGQCCALALYDLVKHFAHAEEARIRTRVQEEVEAWGSLHHIRFEPNRKLTGNIRQYTIDFMAESERPVAINVLIPSSYGTAVAIDRYAAQVLDLKAINKYANMKRVAVLAKPERWRDKQREMVKKLATAVVEIADPDDQRSLAEPQGIAQALDSIQAA